MRCSQRRVCRHQWTANVQALCLLRIAIDELNLESGVVKEKYLGRLHIKIRTEKIFLMTLSPHLSSAITTLIFRLRDFPFDRGAEKGHLLSIDFNGIPDEHILPEIMNVYGSFLFFGTTGAVLPRTGVDILQHGIITQPAHDIESKPDRSCDKVITREQTVPYENVRDIEKLFLGSDIALRHFAV